MKNYDPIEDLPTEIRPEMRLLRAIVDTAVKDAVKGKEDAEQWLRSRSMEEFSYLWIQDYARQFKYHFPTHEEMLEIVSLIAKLRKRHGSRKLLEIYKRKAGIVPSKKKKKKS